MVWWCVGNSDGGDDDRGGDGDGEGDADAADAAGGMMALGW